MFTTPKIKAFIQGASLEGDADEQLVKFLIHITPIKHALAAQMSPIIADRLFKFDQANKPHPVSEMDRPSFNIGTIDLQTMELHPSDDPKMDKHGVLLQAVQISKISARKLFPDNPNFSLIFSAELPKDDLSFSMMGKYFKREVYLTFEAMQMPLPLNGTAPADAVCGFCKNKPVAKDSTGKFLCEKDVKLGVGEVIFITKKETPAQALKRVEADLATKKTPKDDDKDMSHANKPKGGKRKAGR